MVGFVLVSGLGSKRCGVNGVIQSSFVCKSVSTVQGVRYKKLLNNRRNVIPTAQFNYNIYQDGSERAKRTVGSGDRSVVVRKPLGLVLEEGQDGMVFVAAVNKGGNAAETGMINVGDIVVAVSASFGDEVWSTRGVGLERVLTSIKVRSGDFVTLILESATEVQAKKDAAINSAGERRDKARDEFGEREVLNPVTWTAMGNSEDESLRAELENEENSAAEDNGLVLYGSVAIGLAVILLILALSR
mmetsp:Transcript_2443/g.4273  ORF Transcript_2443/g.4273 Transcript_2443/m.4273 type:complete len:245 (-) Transcript_2443:1894-2628(-)